MIVEDVRVGYQDRDDYHFTRWTLDGNQYYLLDGDSKVKLSNGNRIATKDLTDAFEPSRSSQVGLLDSEGHEVIPCNNRSIKIINEDVILVEPAKALSPSVVEANRIKEEDNEAAKQLVPNSAAIREKFYKILGPEGRFIFNNQLSEATICDANGNNLVMGEYYSFVALDNDKLYFCKNTPESEILEYSILPSKVQSDVTPANDSNELDVTNVEVDKNIVEEALNNGEIETPKDNEENNIETPDLGAEINADMGNTQILSTLPEIEAEDETQELITSEEKSPVEEENLLADEGMTLTEETPVEEKEDVVEDTTEPVVEDEKVEDKEDETVSEEPEINIPVADTVIEDKAIDEDVQLDLKDDNIVMDDSIEVSDYEDVPAVDSMYSELDEPEFNENYNDYEEKNTYSVDDFSDRNTVLTEVAKSMTGLIRKTKSLKDQNIRYQTKISKLTEAGRIKDEKIRMQEQKINALESAKNRLEMRDENSQSQIRELKREIANLRREKETMRPGYDELARVLADSREVLGEDSYGNERIYGKVA